MSSPDLDVAVVGAGPKAVSLLCALDRRGVGGVAAFEADQAVGTWDSAFAGTSPTRTGIHFSDTISRGQSLVGSLADYAARHPLMDEQRLAMDEMPKEVFQDYYRAVIASEGLDVRTETPIARIALEGGAFRLQGAGVDLRARTVVDATGIVWSKAWPVWTRGIPAERVYHSIGHGVLNDVAGERIAVIGGGHATPDIATRMAELGAQVTVVIRRGRLAPHFLPYAPQYLSTRFQRTFATLSSALRYKIIRHVHEQGPAVTPRSYADMMRVLRREGQEPGSVELALATEVAVAQTRDDSLRLFLTNGWVRDVDRVICATGFSARLPSLTSLEWAGRAAYEAVIGGFPVLRDDYERLDLGGAYVLGYLAQLGPRGPIDSILHDTQSTVARLASAIAGRLRSATRGILVSPEVEAA